ncbi:LysR substrate-binding domain-containing protein [Chthonobacter rhizosphaerae]|uniref:LysR substrate-binding domain-containing protein n=1 Tax=Chthonobacter rhizosphaerae TaxID=2735553 RepID=UPI0015EE5C52|nr:LysR substrate-binding domain-containing protein [Chthonobacter rhizosphaerae]
MDPLSRVHLNGLRAVEAAGRLGSLARAAEALNVSVGAVSQQILKTEKQLGRTLFRRTPRGLEPTPFGAEVLTHLTDGFHALSRAVALAGPAPETCLTVSVPPVLAGRWLVPRLSAFTADRPDLSIRIDAALAFADLDGGEIDVALRWGEGPWPDVRADRLLVQQVFPICAPALAARLRWPQDLATVPVIRDHGSVDLWTPWLARHGLEGTALRYGPIYSDGSLCLDAAIAGQGVMLGWQTLAYDALRDGRVVAPFAGTAPTGRSYWFISSRGRPLRPVEIAFRDWLAREMASTLDGPPFAALLGPR